MLFGMYYGAAICLVLLAATLYEKLHSFTSLTSSRGWGGKRQWNDDDTECVGPEPETLAVDNKRLTL